jgi:hypothetical protein
MTAARAGALRLLVRVGGLALLAPAAPVGAAPAADVRAAASPTPDIIGGTPTTVGQYPTVVELEIGAFVCTGTLIAPTWVLTAGHCVDPAVLMLPSQDAVTKAVQVHFNTVDIVKDPGTVLSASATFKDPLFNPDPARLGSHDMGLIQLATPVTGVAPSPINLNPAMAPVGTVATLVGYGLTSRSDDQSGTTGVEFELRNHISIPCAGTVPNGSDLNLLCFSQTDNKGTCAGDSGGPAFAIINGTQTLVGVTSFGDKLCVSYGAETRIDIEPQFVLQHIPELGCLADTDCPSHRVCFAHSCIAQPFGPNGIGSVCNTAADCDSTICAVSSQDGKRCSLACSPPDPSTCPDGFECLKSPASVGACWPVPGGGCCDAGPGSPATALVGLGAVALGLRRRRR